MRGLFLAFMLFAMTPAASEKDKTAQFDALFEGYTGNAPDASVIVIHEGEVLLKKSYGMADLEEKRPVTPKTNFRLASVTKPPSASPRRGVSKLDAPLHRYRCRIPLCCPVRP